MSITTNSIKRKRLLMQRKRKKRNIIRAILATIIIFVVIVLLDWLSARIYGWGSGLFGIYGQIYDGYAQRNELRQASYDERFDDYTNILIVGLDSVKKDEGTQADSIVLLSLDKNNNQMRFVVVPCNTLTMIKGRQISEPLGDAFSYGGIRLLQESTADILGVTIHQYAVLEPDTIEELVDAVGGLDIYVEADMKYEDPKDDLSIDIEKGLQHMNGDMAQQYLHYQNDELGTIGRMHRYQVFIKALYEKLNSADFMAMLPQILDIIKNKVDFTTEFYDSAEFTKNIIKIDTSPPTTFMLPGKLAEDGSEGWIYDKGKTEEKMKELFPILNVEDDNADEKKEGWFNW